MARQIGHKTQGDKTTPISVAECTCAETNVTLTTTRGHWERDIAEAARRIANGYEIVPRQITLEDALKKLGVIRVGGAA